MAGEKTYYQILGIHRRASDDDLRAAFHRFARQHHPDNYATAPEEEREKMEELYRQGTEAYRVLRDPEARQNYDKSLREKLAARRPQTGRRLVKLGAPIKVSSRARPYYTRAKQAIQAGKWKEALMQLQIALRNDSQNKELFMQLKLVEQQLKKG